MRSGGGCVRGMGLIVTREIIERAWESVRLGN